MHQKLADADYIAEIVNPEELPSNRAYAAVLNYLLCNQHPRLQPRQKLNLPRTSAVYALFREGELEYVGQTANLGSRIRVHSNANDKSYTRKYFTHFSYFSVPPDFLYAVERRLLRKLRPNQNGKLDRKSWGAVWVDDLAEALEVSPGILQRLCNDYNVSKPFAFSIELQEVLWHLGHSEAGKQIFLQKVLNIS